MAARNLVLVMTLAFAAYGCARDAKSPEAEQIRTDQAAAANAPPPAAPPPPIASQGTGGPIGGGQVGGIGDNPAPIAPAPGPAEVVKDEDELAKIGPNQAQMEAEAQANAQAAARDKAKWEKLAHEQDRRQTADWSRDRAMKAAARAAELQNQSSRVPPAKRGRFNTDMTTFQTRKAEVLSRVNSLSATGTDEWKIAKQQLDHAIDEMDAALMRLEGDF